MVIICIPGPKIPEGDMMGALEGAPSWNSLLACSIYVNTQGTAGLNLTHLPPRI
jgi:hypothetical protein